MDCFVASLLAITADAISHSRDALRPRFVFIFRPLQSEGAGNAGCALHPRSRVRLVLSRLHTSIQGSGEHPTFPAQWLYGLCRALPGDEFLMTPSPPVSFWLADSLTPATGARTTRFCRTLQPRYVSAASASIAPRPTSVTTADALLTRTGWR